MEKTRINQRERRLQILAADLAELERRAAQQRIHGAIDEAKRRVAKLKPGPTILQPYQVQSAVRRIGKGEPVLSISHSLHCGLRGYLPRPCCARLKLQRPPCPPRPWFTLDKMAHFVDS